MAIFAFSLRLLTPGDTRSIHDGGGVGLMYLFGLKFAPMVFLGVNRSVTYHFLGLGANLYVCDMLCKAKISKNMFTFKVSFRCNLNQFWF